MRKRISILLTIILLVLTCSHPYMAIETEHDERRLSSSDASEYYFKNLNDPDMLRYVEDELYLQISKQLGDGYQVDGVNAFFVSKEYLEEVEYNSQSNIFYGYTLEELDETFEGERYVFTLGDSGETTVKVFEEYDDTFDKVIKNVAIGSGVIVICVTVSVITGGAGAPAASMIFAASAKSGAIFALSSGVFSGVVAGTVTGLKTKDMDAALKAAALSGSEGFKWGAISGMVTGGALEALTLKVASSGGLTLNEVAVILKNDKVPAQFLKHIKNIDEYNVICDTAKKLNWSVKQFAEFCLKYKYPAAIVQLFRTPAEASIYTEQASLFAETVGGKTALIRNIDLAYQSTKADGTIVTNLERMKEGLAALDPATGKAYELHHIGQTIDSPLAILTHAEHTVGENYAVLHDVTIADGKGVHALLSNSEWAAMRKEFWKNMYTLVTK